MTAAADREPTTTPMETSSGARAHVPALDGVRGLAALLVMVYHFGRIELPGTGPFAVAFFTQFGWVGVDLFFVLSGFLIGGILLDTRDRPRFLRTFYKRRALRIFPLYFFFLALYMFVLVPFLPGPPTDILARQKWLWTYTANIDIAIHGWYSGVGSHANNLWSLAIEEQFYLVAPFAVLLLSRRGVARLAIAGVVGAIVARVVLAHAGFPGRAGYMLTFARIDALSLGVLLAVLVRRRDQLERLAPAARATLIACIGFVVIFAFETRRFRIDDWLMLQLALPAVTFGCASLLVLAVSRSGAPLVRRAFESRAMRFFGLYSYGLYIWHPLVGRLLRLAGFTEPRVARIIGSPTLAMLVTMVLMMAAATVAALISYRLIERPFLRLKDPRPGSADAPLAPPSPAYDA